MKRPTYYMLVDKVPVAVSNVVEWARWMDAAHDTGVWIVKKEDVFGLEVSTVFLGFDHGWQGPPILFETMVFIKPLNPPKVVEIEKPDGSTQRAEFSREAMEDVDGYTQRYSTWEEAEGGHEFVVNLVRRSFLKLVGNHD